MKLTEKQKKVLEFIADFQTREGFPPSVREMCQGLGTSSPGSMHKHVQALETRGYIENLPGKKRAWKLTQRAWDQVGIQTSPSIPLYGRIAAGLPILAQQNKEEELPIDPALFGSREAFALKVQGDSMKDVQIRDGDLAIIRKQQDAENGQIVAVMVEGLETEATLKILRRKRNAIELHPANEEFKPQVFSGKDRARVTILGKLVGVIRRTP